MLLLGCIICCNWSAERQRVLSIENACEQGMEVDYWTHVGFESDWRLVKVA